jgi:hypothetical protein
MFAGMVNRQIIYCCHPVLVVCPKGVAAAFATLDAARRFVAGRGFRAGLIYRHDGLDWYKVTLPFADGAPPSPLIVEPWLSEAPRPRAGLV